MILNENNIQAPFQYKISDNTFELKTVSGGFSLNTNNVQVKVFSGQRLFCADIGYAIDGAVEEMEFLIDDIKVYPQVLENLEDLQTVQVKDNEVYLIKNELNFKSIVFFPPSDLNKNFKFTSEILGVDIPDEEKYILDKIPFDKEAGCFKTDLKSHNYYGSYYTDSKYLIWLYNKNIKTNKDELKQTIASIIINELVLDDGNYDGSVYDGVAISKILDITNKILEENNILNVDIEKAYDDVKRLFFKGRNEGTIFHNKFTD